MAASRNIVNQIGVSASALTDDVRRAALARKLGFAGLQFPARSASLNLLDLSASGRREFRHMISAQNVRLAGLSADLGSKGFGPGADVDQLLSSLDGALKAAKDLGASLVCLDIGPLPAPPRVARSRPTITPEMAGLLILPDSSALAAVPAPESTNLERIPPSVDPTFAAQVDAALADLGQRADYYCVVLALRSDLSGFGALERAIRAADCPWFGIDLDPVALLGDSLDQDEVFSRLGALIRHVRGRDGVVGGDRRTKPAPIGRGNTDWPRLLSSLDESGFNGWVTVDPLELPDRTAAAASGRAWIEKAASV